MVSTPYEKLNEMELMKKLLNLFLAEIAAPTTVLTTELTLFNKSKTLPSFHSYKFLIFVFHSVKNRIIKKQPNQGSDYNDEWKNGIDAGMTR